ncbi:MAG: PKD domain-containing protein [Bacteroidia bacterium]
MKKLYTFIFLAFLAVTSASAQPCNYTATILQPNTVAFAPPAAYPPGQYYFHWNFGDGSSMYADSNIHIYNTQGTQIITISVYDTANSAVVCTSTDSITLTFCSTHYQQDTLNQSTFNFWADLIPSNNIAEWYFGDSTFTTGQNVNHTYLTPGVYTVTMAQFDSTHTIAICSTSFMVGWNASETCGANIYQSNPTSNIFTLNALVPSSQGTVTWDFGDPNIPNAYGYSMQVAYGNPGTYNICMYYTGGGYNCSYCQQVTVNPSGTCSFITFPDSVNIMSYQFIGNGAGPGEYYVWNFGDGASATGSNYQTHIYATPGAYLACMEVHDSITGNMTCNYCMPITINYNPANCTPNFTAVSIGLNAYFINQSAITWGWGGPTGGINYLWDFGDGDSSTLQFPQHQYAFPGAYTVCLNMFTSACTNTFCDSVVIDTNIVNPTGCTAYFIFTQTAAYQLVAVNLSSGSNLNFSWDFGDGTPLVSGAYPTHQYTTTGTYAVCLTVSTVLGCTDTYCDTLSVDSLGNIIYKGVNAGFVLNVLSPAQLASGINNHTPKQIARLYPVPANDYINIDWASQKNNNVNYKVINAEGREAIAGKLNQKENRINTSILAPGIYLLRIINADGSSESSTFIKQ